MHESLLDIAGAARFFLDSCGVDGPMVDPWAMAEAWGYLVVDASRSQTGLGIIAVRPGRDSGRRFDLAHELGHIVAKHAGLNDRCEFIASAIASAVLLPDAAFKRDLGVYAWDLEVLAELYGVSFEVAARRVQEVRGSVITHWRDDRVVSRSRSAWLSSRGFSRRRVHSWERELASECASHECHIEEDGARFYWDSGDVWSVVPVEVWETLSLRRSKACGDSVERFLFL